MCCRGQAEVGHAVGERVAAQRVEPREGFHPVGVGLFERVRHLDQFTLLAEGERLGAAPGLERLLSAPPRCRETKVDLLEQLCLFCTDGRHSRLHLPSASCRVLTQGRHGVGNESRVARHEGEAMFERLADEDTIEGVTMERRQRG